MAGTHLIAAAYETVELAESALGAVRELDHEHALCLRDAAIVIKHDDGRIELQQTGLPPAGTSTAGGEAIGLLLGSALVVPDAGPPAGLTGDAGAVALDKGISDEQVRRLGATIARGHAVLFALVGEADWAKLGDRLAPFGGELVVSEVADDAPPLLGEARP